jgi:hypothetical protein
MRFPNDGCWEAIVQEMPDFIGEREETRTLDPMIKSLSVINLTGQGYLWRAPIDDLDRH